MIMDHEFYINRCCILANKSQTSNEIPVGSLIVYNNIIIAESHNLSITNNDPTAHAEINVIREVCKNTNNYRINNLILYTSLEPCLMCIAVACEARIKSIVFGAYADHNKNIESKFHYLKKEFNLNHDIKFIGGILELNCSQIIKNFFKVKRGNM